MKEGWSGRVWIPMHADEKHSFFFRLLQNSHWLQKYPNKRPQPVWGPKGHCIIIWMMMAMMSMMMMMMMMMIMMIMMMIVMRGR